MVSCIRLVKIKKKVLTSDENCDNLVLEIKLVKIIKEQIERARGIK